MKVDKKIKVLKKDFDEDEDNDEDDDDNQSYMSYEPLKNLQKKIGTGSKE